MYEVLATSHTPALVLYLLDVSASMEHPMGGRTRLEVALAALREALSAMLFRSTKGAQISPRYLVGIFAYSTDVFDVLGGVLPIDKAAPLLDERLKGIPTQQGTETARAFYQAARVLQQWLPRLYHCPAPLITHLTDGEYTGPDPEPLARLLMQLRVADGYVLIQNIYISDVFARMVQHPQAWRGIRMETPLEDPYARKLRAMSSPIPKTYLRFLREFMNAKLDDGSYMLFPGHTPEFIRFGFQMSAATGTHVQR